MLTDLLILWKSGTRLHLNNEFCQQNFNPLPDIPSVSRPTLEKNRQGEPARHEDQAVPARSGRPVCREQYLADIAAFLEIAMRRSRLGKRKGLGNHRADLALLIQLQQRLHGLA